MVLRIMHFIIFSYYLKRVARSHQFLPDLQIRFLTSDYRREICARFDLLVYDFNLDQGKVTTLG